MMYALERRTGSRWMRCAVCHNRPLLDRVWAGQPQPKKWRVVAVPGSMEAHVKNFTRAA